METQEIINAFPVMIIVLPVMMDSLIHVVLAPLMTVSPIFFSTAQKNVWKSALMESIKMLVP